MEYEIRLHAFDGQKSEFQIPKVLPFDTWRLFMVSLFLSEKISLIAMNYTTMITINDNLLCMFVQFLCVIIVYNQISKALSEPNP